MKGVVAYAAVTLLLALAILSVLWPVLSPDGRTGVAAAAAVAWPVQAGSFALLIRVRDRVNGFLGVWVGGTLVRMGLVVAAAVVVARRPELSPLPTLLALAGFFFVMLLLEPLFLVPLARDGSGSDGRTGIDTSS